MKTTSAQVPATSRKPRSAPAASRKLRKPRKQAKQAPKVPRSLAMVIAREATMGRIDTIRGLAAPGHPVGSWEYHALRLVEWFDSGMAGDTPFEVFSPGIAKVPFSCFSSLPIVNCPGAGDCVSFCYSLKCWRHPAPLFRQVQNTLLLQSQAGRDVLTAAFNRIPAGNLRLFVDGDFANVDQVYFFMGLLRSRPDVLAYGYSKSWVELVAAQLKGIEWPENYVLNMSSGSSHQDYGIRAAMLRLPIVRGDFLAVDVPQVHIKSGAYQGRHKAGYAEYRRAVQAALPGERIFVCPGRCGACLPGGGQACGSKRFAGIKIVIAKH